MSVTKRTTEDAAVGEQASVEQELRRSKRVRKAPKQFRFEDFPDDAEVLREERLWERGQIQDTDNDYCDEDEADEEPDSDDEAAIVDDDESLSVDEDVEEEEEEEDEEYSTDESDEESFDEDLLEEDDDDDECTESDETPTEDAPTCCEAAAEQGKTCTCAEDIVAARGE